MPKKRTERQQAWSRFGLPQAGRAALAEFNAKVRPFLQRCGAKRRTDGEPCQAPVVPGKNRCRWHGGLVPSGDAWHTLQWPKGDAKDWQKKLNAKLQRDERNRRRRERRLARMSPDERAKFDEWAKYHRPGSKIERSKPRAAKKVAAEFKKRAEQPERPVSPEVAALQAQAAYLEAERDRYRAMATGARPQEKGNGVFD
ncbi:HGGxSTG domain-containing protein [Shinella zoogloeoides]